jgi:hypothetical protein
MRRHPASYLRRAAALAALILLLPAAAAAAPDGDVVEVLTEVDAAQRLDDLSESVWPEWDISETPVAVMSRDGVCYLVDHPHPPSSFTRMRDMYAVESAIHRGPSDDADITPAAGLVGDDPTAFTTVDELLADGLPAIFSDVFRAYLTEHCPGMSTPIDLMAGYPSDARNLALVDIECELLKRALAAPESELERHVIEFVSVRSVRRLAMGQRFVDYERQREWIDGLPAYVGERSRQMAMSHLGGRGKELFEADLARSRSLEDCLPDIVDLDWYRTERFLWSGAGVCLLLDRYHPTWRGEVAERCIDPYQLLFELTKRKTVRTTDLLAEFGIDDRLADRALFIDETKSGPERLFDEIRNSERRLILNVHLLSSVTVSYDRDNIEEVDAHRAVHKRILKVEYSSGTRLELVGHPIAAILGQDEFDFQQLILELPDDLTVTVEGEPLELNGGGVHQLDRPFVIEATGVRIEGQICAIMIGEGQTTIVLHR